MQTDLTPAELRHADAQEAAQEFAKKCRSIEEHTSVEAETSLNELVNHLMTELWDSGFSVAEIRAAFEAAANDVERYAAGAERNGTGIRGTAVR